MFAFFALWYIVSVPASWGAKTGCHPATVLDWNGAVETYKNDTDDQYFASLDWGLASTWGVPAEENEYQTTAATTTTSSTTIGITNLTTTKTKIGRSRRLADDAQYWTETAGTCVDDKKNKVSHYYKKFSKTDKVKCQTYCEKSLGCEAYAISLEADGGQFKTSSCSLYGEQLVPPNEFNFVALQGKRVVQGEFPDANDIYPLRCFVRVLDTPVKGSTPSRLSVVTDTGHPQGLAVTLALENQNAAASYIQLEQSVLSLHNSILEVTGARSLCAPVDECDLAHAGTDPTVLASSTYVSPSDTVVKPRVVRINCSDVADRMTTVSCHADGTWHAAGACLSTTSTTTRAPTTSTSVSTTFLRTTLASTSTTTIEGTAAEQVVNAVTRFVTNNLLVSIIIGVVVAVIILLLIIVCGIVCCLRRINKKYKLKQQKSHTSVELTELMGTDDAFWTSEGDTLLAQRDPDNLRQVLYGVKLPPEVRIQPVPLIKRTLETSNYKFLYDTAKRPRDTNTFLSATKHLVRNVAWKQRIAMDDANQFFNQLKVQAASNIDVWGDLDGAAELQWTSAKKLNGVEFCSYLNQALREDRVEDMIHAVVIIRAITNRIVGRVAKDYILTDIPDVVWRGGGFDNRFQYFFEVGVRYRVPGFLATSIQKFTAERFLRRVPEGRARCLWKVEMDETCTHAMLLQKSHLKEEKEYLFAPYSVFEITSVEWSQEEEVPHKICVGAAADNRKHSLCLPLAPYY